MGKGKSKSKSKSRSYWKRKYTKLAFNSQAAISKILFRERHAQYELRFTSLSTATTAAFAAAEKALAKADAAMEKRFDSVNEFRQTLTDQAATFIPRAEAEQRIKVIADKVESQGSVSDKSIGRISQSERGWNYLIGALLVAAAWAAVFVSHKP
jgi:hypothetical protein